MSQVCVYWAINSWMVSACRSEVHGTFGSDFVASLVFLSCFYRLSMYQRILLYIIISSRHPSIAPQPLPPRLMLINNRFSDMSAIVCYGYHLCAITTAPASNRSLVGALVHISEIYNGTCRLSSSSNQCPVIAPTTRFIYYYQQKFRIKL